MGRSQKRGYKFLVSVMDKLNVDEDVLYNLKWIQNNEKWSFTLFNMGVEPK